VTVDVVIPTYQESERLFRAVESVLSQTVPVDHIIVVDGGSQEDVRKSLKEYFAKDSRVSLVLNEHTGLPGVGRETGIRLSSADWIAFLDADDVWEPRKIEQQLAFGEDTKSRFICTNASKIKHGLLSENYFPENSVLPAITFRDMIRDNKVIMSSALVDRKLLLDVGIFASGHHVRAVEDYATWLRCSSITKIAFLDQPLVKYEISESGMSASAVPDASIFAISDFINWSKETKVLSSSDSKKIRKEALKSIKSRFL
jgi:teichuronic acid biosynthesis glycosyltransferase TuaG